MWCIRDGGKENSTGFPSDQRLDAEAALQRYLIDQGSLYHKNGDVPLFIYAVSAKVENYPIKIGFTTNSKLRFIGLQLAMPYKIDVLGIWKIRDYAVERMIHRKFRHLKLCGEWFARTPELLSFIADINRRNGPIGNAVAILDGTSVGNPVKMPGQESDVGP